MNIQSTYTLTSPRRCKSVFAEVDIAFTRCVLCAIVLLCDVAAIVCMSLLTGIGYHFLVYREIGNILSFFEVGARCRMIFAIANQFRGEYRLSEFLHIQAALAALHSSLECHFHLSVGFGFLAQISVVYSRGWFILYYGSTVCCSARFEICNRALTVHGTGSECSQRRGSSCSAGRQINDFVTRYEPKSFGVNIVGCHFLTPMAPGSPATFGARCLRPTSSKRSPARGCSNPTRFSWSCHGPLRRRSTPVSRPCSSFQRKFIWELNTFSIDSSTLSCHGSDRW